MSVHMSVFHVPCPQISTASSSISNAVVQEVVPSLSNTTTCGLKEGRKMPKNIPERIAAPKSVYIIWPYLTSCVSATSITWYIYNYYNIYIYIIYCNLLLISTPLRLVSKTAFTAAKCSPMLASLPAKWEPKCATCSPSWRCTCPRQLRTRSRKKSAGFQKWFPMSFEVLLALTSLFIIGLFSDVQLWFFMVFHHFSCLFSWWLWAILGTALPFRGRPRSSSTAKRPPGPRAQMRLSSVTLRPWSFLGRNYQKLGTDVRKKKADNGW